MYMNEKRILQILQGLRRLMLKATIALEKAAQVLTLMENCIRVRRKGGILIKY